MSTILDNFDKANEYFTDNYSRVQRKYPDVIADFRRTYNNIAPNPGPGITPSQGTAIAIALRALKFLYTAFDLIKHGHTQESRIIQRNIQELRLVTLDVATDPEAYDLWRLVQRKKEEVKENGIVDSKKLKEMILKDAGGEKLGKLTVESSIRRLKRKKHDYIDKVLREIIRERDTISEFVSHENIFNLVRRMDIVDIGEGAN